MLEILDPAPADVQDLLWNLAHSEVDSESNHGDRWRTALGRRLTHLVSKGARSSLSGTDWDDLRSGLRAARGPYLEPLLSLGPRWYFGRVLTSQLGAIRLIRHEPFRAIAPTLLLSDFVASLEAGADTPGDRFAGRYRRLRASFDPLRARGSPALVAKSLAGPFTEIDGLTRMSLLLSRVGVSQPVPEAISVLVGVSQRIHEWPWY